jgi:hypothetical protein
LQQAIKHSINPEFVDRLAELMSDQNVDWVVGEPQLPVPVIKDDSTVLLKSDFKFWLIRLSEKTPIMALIPVEV